jgi:multiple sugar transport system permease protein
MSSERAGRRPRRRRALSYGASAALLAVTLFPVLWLAQVSLKTDVEAMRVPPAIFFVPTLDNYAAVFQGKFARSFVNSLVVSLSTTLIAMILGVPAAYALSRASFGRSRGLAL